MESFLEGLNLSNVKRTSNSKEIFLFIITDAQKRKRGYQTGLETQVVHAVKYRYLYIIYKIKYEVKVLNISPEKYSCKIETQRNWRGFFLAVEYVV